MDIIIKSAQIIDPNSIHHNQVRDILIIDGCIQQIAASIEKNAIEVYDAKGTFVSPGWLDMYTTIGDPGLEHKESAESAINASSKGGFTGIVTTPKTSPCVQSKSEIEYLKGKSNQAIVDIFPLGAVSKNTAGKEITEMYDMYNAGAVGFTDGHQSIHHSGLMLRALQYVKTIDSVILNYPNEDNLTLGAVMNESEVSAKLGLKGTPAIAEELMVVRDIELAKYADSRVHIAHVSTKKSIDLIRSAKKEGIKITCSVPSYQVVFTDEELDSYDSNYKVKPSLRGKEDVQAIIDGLKDDTIDVICSNHSPQEEEVKKVEFDYAYYGMINLETSFSLVNEYLKDKIGLEGIVNKMAIAPREILNIPVPVIEEGAIANLTLFNDQEEWVYDLSSIASISKNSPFINRTLKGKVKLIINKNKVVKNN